MDNFYSPENQEKLPILYEVAFAGTSVPEGVADGIWNKATAFVSDKETITSAPGCEPKDKMVKSKTGVATNLVTNKKENQHTCDDKCPQYRFKCSDTNV